MYNKKETLGIERITNVYNLIKKWEDAGVKYGLGKLHTEDEFEMKFNVYHDAFTIRVNGRSELVVQYNGGIITHDIITENTDTSNNVVFFSHCQHERASEATEYYSTILNFIKETLKKENEN